MKDPYVASANMASPAKSVSRVDDGKVRKPKASYKSGMPAAQHINGKTYACESCKRGHRVHKCDHGRTRPISETNQPGRPSAGQKRGCQCPRNCACTTKTCKCERNCACTQEMFLIVRLDHPIVISREATSTPKPVWEDTDGSQLTLKKVWADANGKEIDEEEYEARRRLMQEREDAAKATPTPSCCGSKQIKDEPDPPKRGCRHRQNVAAIQPHPVPSSPQPTLQLPTPEPWMSTCTCGSGCSCLYCPDHPNNATSINHAQQQFKNLTEQGYRGDHVLTPVPSNTEDTSRSCMGGRPSFFLSSTPEVSQDQLQQFYAETLNPNPIFLKYPIQSHTWTNSPLPSHCSHAHSPSAGMTMSPEHPHTMSEPAGAMSTPMALFNDVDRVWDFSGNQLGAGSFSWLGMDASYGTDYNIGQATVVSTLDNAPLQMLRVPKAMANLPLPSNFPPDSLLPLDHNTFTGFDDPVPLEAFPADMLRPAPVPSSVSRPANAGGCSTPWAGFDLPDDARVDHDFHISGLSATNSPIFNHV